MINTKKIILKTISILLIIAALSLTFTISNNDIIKVSKQNNSKMKYSEDIEVISGFKKVATGNYHSMAIDNEDNLWVWGSNFYGELGNGTTNKSTIPIQIKIGTKFKEIEAGMNHSMAIDTEGNLWTWGYNKYGQLGNGQNGDTVYEINPIQIKPGVKFSKIDTIAETSFAIDSKGNLWGWGYNAHAQLGNGQSGDQLCSQNPIQINSGVKYKDVAAGYIHTVALDIEGNLWSWGNNGYGQLGNGSTLNSKRPVKINTQVKFDKITAGQHRSAAIDTEGNLWAWGNNTNGQLGDGTTNNRNTPVQIQVGTKFSKISGSLTYNMGIDTEGNLWSFSKSSSIIKEGTKFIDVAGIWMHCLAIGEDGSLWGSGNNGNGQLGNNSTEDSNDFIIIVDGNKNPEEEYYITSDIYDIDTTNNIITKVKPETTVEKFLNNIDTNGQCKVLNSKKEELSDSSLVGTGCILQVTYKDKIYEYEIAVRGDLDGNGKVTITDLSMINQALTKKITLTEIQEKAADIDYTGNLSITDLSMINQALTGKIKL